MEHKVQRQRPKVKEVGEYAPWLVVRERRFIAKVELQRSNDLTLLTMGVNETVGVQIVHDALTTATLVSTERASHVLVTGGIWVIQASIPTGMSSKPDDARSERQWWSLSDTTSGRWFEQKMCKCNPVRTQIRVALSWHH